MTARQLDLFADPLGSNLNTPFDRARRAQHYGREVEAFSREVATMAQRLHSLLTDPKLADDDPAVVTARGKLVGQVQVVVDVILADLRILTDQPTGGR